MRRFPFPFSQTRIIALLLVMPCLGVAGCGHTADESSARVEDASKQAAVVEPVEVEPLAYFEDKCARCHGPQGRNYGDAFGEDLSEHELHEVVDEMAAGPGFAPLEGEALEIQVAYHRSLIANEPFIIWNQAQGQTWSGEVYPGSSVRVKVDGETFPAQVGDATWQVALPADWRAQAAEGVWLIAEYDEAATQLNLTESAYSHHQPLSGAEEH